MKSLRGLLVEALAVVAAGLALGWTGNALNPGGLRVDRDYFPRAATTRGVSTAAPRPAVSDPTAPHPVPHGSSASEPAVHAPEAADAGAPEAPDAADPAHAAALERLRERGLVPIGFEEARALFEDPLCAAGAYVFLDARNEEEHARGHIPGARVFDHYHMERYLADVMALAPGTMRMVVYCSGGECEDSEFAAATLAGLLPDPSILRVYVGGMTEWEQRGMPVESGPAGSGAITGGVR